MFGSNRQEEVATYEPRDTLAIFKDDGTADIVPVVSINDERLLAGPYVGDGQYSIPINDLKCFTGPRGRVWLYPTTIENVTDCQRIAALERSTVLRQITHFSDPVIVDDRKPVSKWMIFGGAAAIFLLILLVAN